MGLHDLSKVEGNLRYDAKIEGRFVPLNGKREMSFKEIMNTHAKGIEYANTVKGSLYSVLEDEKGILSLIPIINSDRTKVTSNTKDMLIDITGTSQYIVEKAADMFACMFIDLGGDVKRVRIKYGRRSVLTPEMESRVIEIKPRDIEEQIGASIGFNNILSLATKMGYKAVFVNRRIRFFVPPYRFDIINEQDIIEDIAIAYGYSYIHPIPILTVASGGRLEEKTKLNRKLTTLMLGLGFTETNNNYLTNERMNFKNMLIEEKPHVQIKEAKTENISMMRTWLLPSLLNVLGSSSHESMPQKVFELDLVFNISEDKVIESHHLAGLAVSPKANFNDIKAIVSSLMHALGIEFKVSEEKIGSFIEGRCARIESNSIRGFFGELHPQVLNNFGIGEPAIAFELELPY